MATRWQPTAKKPVFSMVTECNALRNCLSNYLIIACKISANCKADGRIDNEKPPADMTDGSSHDEVKS